MTEAGLIHQGGKPSILVHSHAEQQDKACRDKCKWLESSPRIVSGFWLSKDQTTPVVPISSAGLRDNIPSDSDMTPLLQEHAWLLLKGEVGDSSSCCLLFHQVIIIKSLGSTNSYPSFSVGRKVRSWPLHRIVLGPQLATPEKGGPS